MESEIDAFLHSKDPKRINSERVQREYRAGTSVVSSMPQTLTLTTTTHCNLKCVMCEHGNSGVERREHLDVSVLSKLGPFLEHAKWIDLFGIGEPMTSPSFWSTLDALQPLSEMEVAIISNATALTRARIERLLDSRLTQVSFSLDAATSETYRRIRGSDFDRVREGIRALVMARNERKSSKLRLFANMTLMRENIRELPAFVDLVADLGLDGLSFWPMHDLAHARHWTTRREGWEFRYEDQLLSNCRELARQMIERALSRAADLNVPVLWGEHKSLGIEGLP